MGDVATLKAGLRFGVEQSGTDSPRPHVEPLREPRAFWTLQVFRGRWVLLLASYGPCDLELPAGFENRELDIEDVDGAMAWAQSVLPQITTNTVTRAEASP